jgi:hypothetical protein
MIKEYYVVLGFTAAQKFHDGGRHTVGHLTGSVPSQVLMDVEQGRSR